MKFPVVAALIAAVALAAPAQAAAKKQRKTVARANATAVQVRPGVDPYAVYVGGEYIGRDPDPSIRAYMAHNPHIWDGLQ